MKTYLALGIVVVVMAVAAVLTVYSLMSSARELDQVRQVELDMLRCRRHEKDFLARRDTTYLGKHAAAYSRLAAGVERIEAAAPGLSILPHTEDYRIAFHDIVQAMSEVGLTEDEGLRGELRVAIHSAEKALEGHDDLLILLLRCRRHEKDFLLRRDPIYVDRFERSVDDLLRAVFTSAVAAGGEFGVPDLISAYRHAFQNLVSRMIGIGLAEDRGLRGKMRTAVHRTESTFEQLQSLADVDRTRIFRDSIALGALLLGLTAIAIWLLFNGMKKDAAWREKAARG